MRKSGKFSVYKCLRVRVGTFEILFRGNLYSSEENFFLLYISQVQIKKKKKTFASYKKIRTFASRLLSHKDKHLIHSGLISLCPRWLIRGEAKI
ncbi:hypothetical protein DW992_11925 [Bacteroides stercoris]|nr:hypothetical protein DW992_11925 [Bacteroides stercoris]